jgi:beta-mannosidase
MILNFCALYTLGVGTIMRISSLLQAAAFPLFGSAVLENSPKVFDLSGAKWRLSSSIYNISVPGSVPSQAHLDLYNAGVIPDPYFGLGDFDLRWVAETNWTYSTVLEGL